MSYIDDLCKLPPLTTPVEQELAHRIQAGDIEAANKLATHNTRFAVKCARSKLQMGLSLDDAVSASLEGLAVASRRFRPNEGRFITYAVHWIKQALFQNYLVTSSPVRIPAAFSAEAKKLRRIYSDHIVKHGTAPSVADFKGYKKTPSVPEAAILAFTTHKELDAPLGAVRGELNLTMADTITDGAAAIDDSLGQALEFDRLSKVMAEVLSDREREILSMRFGLDDDNPQTLEAIGARFGFSRERARQIYEIALHKIRKSEGTAGKVGEAPYIVAVKKRNELSRRRVLAKGLHNG